MAVTVPRTFLGQIPVAVMLNESFVAPFFTNTRISHEVGVSSLVLSLAKPTPHESKRRGPALQRKNPDRIGAFHNGGPSWDRTRDLMLIKHAL